MVEKQEQFVWRRFHGLILLRNGGRILRDIASPGGDRAVHANPRVIGAVPLAPAISFGGFRPGP